MLSPHYSKVIPEVTQFKASGISHSSGKQAVPANTYQDSPLPSAGNRKPDALTSRSLPSSEKGDTWTAQEIKRNIYFGP